MAVKKKATKEFLLERCRWRDRRLRGFICYVKKMPFGRKRNSIRRLTHFFKPKDLVCQQLCCGDTSGMWSRALQVTAGEDHWVVNGYFFVKCKTLQHVVCTKVGFGLPISRPENWHWRV